MKKTELSFLTFLWIWNKTQGLSTPRHHRQICRFLSTVWQSENRQALLMAFRNSGKSTLVGLFCAWILCVCPQMRILILSADYELAKKMVRNIKRIIEHHPLTQGLKPAAKDQWASDRFTVVRPVELRDPSVLARGLGANITGSRADVIVCDDVEVPKTCDTPGKRADLRQKLSELDFVLVPGGMQLYVGTPHTYDTIYKTDSEGFLSGFTELLLPVLTSSGQSRWPERFPLAKIKSIQKRAGPLKFMSQMLLKPVQLTQGRLDVDKIQFYADELVYHQSNLSAELKINETKLVSASCWWDPSFGRKDKSDSSVIACLFTDEKGFYYLHDVLYLTVEKAEESASLQCHAVADFVAKYHLPSVMVETNGIGKFLPEILRKTLAERRIRCSVLEKISRIQKETRILSAFDAVLADKRLMVHERIRQTPFLTEMREWIPFGKTHDDGLDAVAGCLLSEPIRLPRCAAMPLKRPDWRYGQPLPTLDLSFIDC